MSEMRDFSVPENRMEKNGELSYMARQEGNAAYSKKDLSAALRFYNDSVRLAPVATDEEAAALALSFGNRSAVLFEMGRHKDCVNDIARAVLAGYPKDKWERLLSRRRRCMETLAAAKMVADDGMAAAKGKLRSAKIKNGYDDDDGDEEREFSGTGGSQEAQVGDENKAIKSGPAASPIDTHEDNESSEKKITWMELSTSDFQTRYQHDVPKLSDEHHPNYWNLSNGVELKVDNERGRHFVAKRDIAPGEILIVEVPYAAVLDSKFWKTHCQHCMERTDIVVPCQTCASVIFCSEDCRSRAHRYHYVECPIVENLGDSQMCIRLDSLRLVTKHPAMVLRAVRRNLARLIDEHKTDSTAVTKKLPNMPASGDDLDNCFSLMSHLTQRDRGNFYEYALSALYLYKALEATGYLRLQVAGSGDDMGLDDGGLLSCAEPETEEQDQDMVLKLLFLACLIRSTNSYTIVENKLKLPDLWDSDRIRLGAGLFPLGSFLNHSCEPNTTRDYANGRLIVAASCPIARGEEVTALYYKTFQDAPRQQRQDYLKRMYMFDCNCLACTENWPDGAKMQRDPRRLLVRCPKCFKVERMGDPLTLTRCPACQGDLDRYSDALSSAWTGVLKTFGRMERGDRAIAHDAPHTMAEYMKINAQLVLPPDGDFFFAKGLFARSLRIVRGLQREERRQLEADFEKQIRKDENEG